MKFLSKFTSIFKKPKKMMEEYNPENEKIYTPLQIAAKNYFSNKLAVFGLFTFVALTLFCFIGSLVFPINYFDTETDLMNISPGRKFLDVPQVENVKYIENGVSFGYLIDGDSKLRSWGIDEKNSLKGMPKALKNKKIEHLAVGDRHVVAITKDGDFFAWGYDINDQIEQPSVFTGTFRPQKLKKVIASVRSNAFLSTDGKAYIWGDNSVKQSLVDPDIQGKIKDIFAGKANYAFLLDDGSIKISGSNIINEIPERFTNGTVKAKKVALTEYNALVLTEDGKLDTWGSGKAGLNIDDIPQMDSKVIDIAATNYNFVALTEKGTVYSWGNGKFKENQVNGLTNIKNIYAKYYSIYAVDNNGKIHAFGNKGYILGSDEVGRDLLLRLIHGGTFSLLVGIIAVVIATIIGVIVGMICGFFGGWIDNLLQRFAEIVSSIPFLPLIITLSFLMGNNTSEFFRMFLVMLLIGLLSWVGLSRIIRAQIFVEREKDFVLAARALGLKESQIIIKHILPSVVNYIIVSVTLMYAGTMLTESGLSFLGFGVPVPYPSWGNMLETAKRSEVLTQYWWRWIFPAMFILIAVLSVNIIGDGLRDALDPKSSEK